MNFTATFIDSFSPILKCSSCCDLRLASSSIAVKRRCSVRSNLQANSVSRLVLRRRPRFVVCCVTDTEAEPDNNNNNDDKEKEIVENGNTTSSLDFLQKLSEQPSSQPVTVGQEKEIVESANTTSSLDFLQKLSEQQSSQPVTVDQGKEIVENSKIVSSLESLRKLNGQPSSQPVTIDQDNKESVETNTLESKNLADNSESELKPEGDAQEDLAVASGSPLPGLKLGETIRIPKETIDIMKDQVFGFDSFFVTSQEPYEGGVLFKGNLRGKAAISFERIKKRMENKFEDQYKVFLLINPEDDKPVVVVVPKRTLEPGKPAVPEWLAAAAFGLVTISTLLLRNVPELQSNVLSVLDNIGSLKNGLSGALVTALVLGVHELGHVLVAKSTGIKLAVPYFVPSSQIGSFGAITRIVNIVPNREDLLKFAAAGPIAGFSVGFILLLLGFYIPPSDGIGVVVDASVFHESFLAGGIAKLLLGDALKEGTPISLNPLVIWAWAGLLINAINSIPAGELDGGRISLALWGRKASSRLTSAVIILLGLSSLFSDVAFYWVVLIFFLQRGPIAPLSEEISDPEDKYVALGVTVLFLGLLVCLPYPFSFSETMMSSF